MSPQYGELRPTNGSDRFTSLGQPSTFQRVSRLGFVTAPTNQTLHDLWPSPGLVHNIQGGTKNGATFIFGRPFVKRFALRFRSVVLSVLSVCNVRALWPNGWTDH